MADDRSDRVAMWQTYVMTAENTSTRRESINRYMVLVNLAVFSAHFALPGEITLLTHTIISSVGVVASALWVSILDSHAKINKVKYDIIRKLEVDLPCQPFDEEAKRSRIDTPRKRLYLPLSKMQTFVVGLIFTTHFLSGAYFLYQWVLCSVD